MLALIILILVVVAGSAFLLWASKSVGVSHPDALGRPEPRSLFEAPELEATQSEAAQSRSADLSERAKRRDLTALADATRAADPGLYEAVLNLLIDASNDSTQLGELAAYISKSESLRSKPRLAERLIEEFKFAPSLRTATEMLHIAARSDDADTYHLAVDTCIEAWHCGHLSRLSAAELTTLIESQFWALAQQARRGGPGFRLKRRLAGIRQELADAKSARRTGH